MPLGLSEYIDSLEDRRDLIWPKPPKPVPLKATPSVAPLPGIKVVTWNIYGTLLRIDQGQLMFSHPQELRMQIALEKTIAEFNMWNSMSRKPGQPWEYMLRQYSAVVEEAGMVSTKRKGDYPETDSRKIWKKLLERLVKNEYEWDQGLYGDLDDLAAKVAYFFHANLQGTAANDHAAEVLSQLMTGGVRCGLLADGQVFTLPQLLRDLKRQSGVSRMTDVLSMDFVILSTQVGLRKPSVSLFREAVDRFQQKGISPEQVLHVSQLHSDDLAFAKKAGMKTALFAADKSTCRVNAEELKMPDRKPDRLISDLRQIRDILQI